jgi:phospholipid/cholesterol/gamma-HCH transport system permease protein
MKLRSKEIVKQVFECGVMKLRSNEIVKQVFECGVMSLPIIGFSLSIVSLMSVLEFSWHMKVVLKHDSLVPAFSMVLMVREVAPVVTSMLLASRLGASIAAELGVMKITDQLDQLRLLSVSRFDFLFVPRWFGCLIAAVTLTLVSLATSVCVSTVLGAKTMGYQSFEFFNSLFLFTRGYDLLGSLLKAACFGTLIPLVAFFYGIRTEKGSYGVGDAATRSVVLSSLLIIITDFLINSFFWMP